MEMMSIFNTQQLVALNYKEIEPNPERISNFKPFINKYNWKGINYPSTLDDWRRFEKNDPTTALNVLYTKEKEIIPAYISKHNLTCGKQIVILMITNKEKEGWHYLGLKFFCIIT